MVNYNGQLILSVLKTIETPATLNTIAQEVAKKCGKSISDIYETVKSTLSEGVKLGFVQRENKRYVVASDVNEEEENKEDENVEEEQPQDATRRRRRRRSTSRRRRSGSRRRRSRSRRRRSRRSRS